MKAEDGNNDQLTIKRALFLEEMFSNREDVIRCLGSLSKLDRHLQQPIILTGSIATSWQLLRNGMSRGKKQLTDIDIVVESLACIRTSLTQDFLINHFHPQRKRGSIFIQLVDAEYRIRIDVFTPQSETLMQRLSEVAVNDLSCWVVASEDVLTKLLSVILAVTNGEQVDPKYVAHFNLLFQVADLELARRVWQDYRKESQPLDFDEATAAVYHSLEAAPELLKMEEYNHNINLTCPWCCASKVFPLADRNQIYHLLGYV